MILINSVTENLIVVKRSGQRVPFNGNKIAIAIKSAFDSVYDDSHSDEINTIYNEVLKFIEENYKNRKTIMVEDIQDLIEKILNEDKYLNVYNSFKEYRRMRNFSRNFFEEKQQHKFAKIVEKLDLTLKNEETISSIDLVENFKDTISEEFAKSYLIDNKYLRKHEEGYIFIDDIKSYATSVTKSSFVNFLDLSFKYDNLFAFSNKIIESINNFHKEQSGIEQISNIENIFKNVLIGNFKNVLKEKIVNYFDLEGILDFVNKDKIFDRINEIESINIDESFFNSLYINLKYEYIFKVAIIHSKNKMDLLLKNSLNNLFTSIDSNTSISLEYSNDFDKKFIINKYLEVVCNNNINTIFKIDNIDNLDKFTYNLLIKNLSNNNFYLYFLDNDNIDIFPSGELIYDNIIDEKSNSLGRCILSKCYLNLVRIAIMANKNNKLFYELLDKHLELCKNMLVQRFDMQASKYKYNYKYILDENYLKDSDKISDDQKVRRVFKNGTLNINIVGIYEACSYLAKDNDIYGEVMKLSEYLNNKVNDFTIEEKLNFKIAECYNKHVFDTFILIDKSIYGNNVKFDNYNVIDKYIDDIDFKVKYIKYIDSKINIKIDKKNIEDELNKISKYKGILFKVEVSM